MMSSEFTRSAYYFFTEIQYYSDHGYVFEQTTIDSKVELSTFYDQTGITYLLSGDKGEDIYFESFWAFETSGSNSNSTFWDPKNITSFSTIN